MRSTSMCACVCMYVHTCMFISNGVMRTFSFRTLLEVECQENLKGYASRIAQHAAECPSSGPSSIAIDDELRFRFNNCLTLYIVRFLAKPIA